MANPIEKRYEFVLFFDVENGNPNGDPDAGNLPRIDPETSLGIVTDVCLKRKVRNYVDIAKRDKEGNTLPGYDIYVRESHALNAQHRKAYSFIGREPEPKKLPKDVAEAEKVIRFMCNNFFDIRTFGAVMTTEVNCGQVRGPVQFNFARSIDPIVQQEITITRMAVTNEKDLEKKDREMGRKYIVPYALYRVEGYISAYLAQKTGFSEDDLNLLWEALINMFEHDHSAARGKMASRKLFVFEHETALGNAPAHKLFELIKVEKVDSSKPARSFHDYVIRFDSSKIPQGVRCEEKL
ncbi:CRISPR-associated protein, Csd2 family [Desulfotomaculum nigrificans CO-1-SRB]|uniref:CRISPR-associated protein, Csd2 family n=1 Tax=Desulfotomaculum nigrificans (strain DSM 14880 / VKM B-2319 / CO-1-SRB) TaxID=868595 RepID=F6B7Q7_DESCC|nr:type I-C CRISPR-associated protein Cas7/Csd2 [Desulfotomaculum nigrificans]AEF93429.1 CRISPR-associated protein, Csd2 family [Desulfotomaculum nigrificans CO-1-SRB]